MRYLITLTLFAAVVTVTGPGPAAAVGWQPDGVPVCTAASNQLTPVSVSDGSGGAIVAWYDYRSGNADIYAQRVLPSGATDPTWPTDGRALCTASGGQYSPVIVSDGGGGAIVVWQDDRGSRSDIYAQHVLASGTVDPSWPVNGRALCSAPADQISPAATSDGIGGAIVTWRDDRGGPDTDIYAQRVRASGVVDPSWPSNGRALCTADGNQSVPLIVPDGAGGALVSWSDLRNGTDSDIYIQRVLASGAVDPAWPADGRALCTAAWNQSGPTITSDGSDGAIVSWHDYRSGIDADIYAQHVLGTGALDPMWPANGRALCTAVGEQYATQVVVDGGGGAIVVWYDYRGGEEADIYAGRVVPGGTTDSAWPADGLGLCMVTGDQVTPNLVADGAGGFVAAWVDYRNGASSDIYAQRVSSSGVVDPLWPVNGATICASSGEQYSPSLVPGGSEGVIASWTDFRPGVYADIYAQWVEVSGVVAATGERMSEGVRLRAVRPNPASGGAESVLELPIRLRVTVEVLDMAGRRVRTLVAAEERAAGPHRIEWDGADEAGIPAGAGIYWIRVRTRAGDLARKLALLR